MAEKKDYRKEEQEDVRLIRIVGKDIRGNKKILPGLTSIKGISWAFSNALCKILKINIKKNIQDLEEEEMGKIEEFIKDPKIPTFLKNRQKDFDSGEDLHLNGADLRLKKEFDVKRLRKIKSYRGIRHAAKLPTRGQRTKGNFRSNKKKTGGVGMKKKK